ncbi:Calx-beta domain-containing protein [Salisaeta longa]|uniref:Calx-beta domain-containing protein n=1 Tax=Salisaeta longa TaxID=503170 RepID=UPI0003B71A0F|nr:Calx-beta domain-containing protein [Salisaeta longa]
MSRTLSAVFGCVLLLLAVPPAQGQTGSLIQDHAVVSTAPNGLSFYGERVVAVGDIDGNGVRDLAVGAPATPYNGQSSVGAVVLHFMQADGTIRDTATIDATDMGAAVLMPFGTIEPAFGSGITSIGDVDGNGVPDLAIGASGDKTLDINQDGVSDCADDGANTFPPGAGPDDIACNGKVGALYIVRLNSSGDVLGFDKFDDTHPLLTLDRRNTSNTPNTGFGGAYFGESISALGDVDGTGGSITTLALGTRRLIDDGITQGSQSPGGFVLAQIGWNGGAAELTAAQTVDNSVLDNAGLTNVPAGARFGQSVAALNDLDGGGTPELLVGAYTDDLGGTNRGAVYLVDLDYDNAANTFSIDRHTRFGDGVGGIALDSWPSNSNFGTSIAVVDDLDGNGTSEVLIGAEGWHPFGEPANDQGAAYLLYTNDLNAALDGTTSLVRSLFALRSGTNGFNPSPALAAGDLFGSGVAAVDLNGDAVPTFYVGARSTSFDPPSGRVHRLSVAPVLEHTLALTARTDNGSSTASRSDNTLDPGDVVTYTITGANNSYVGVANGTVDLPLDPNLTLVPGSITTNVGTVASGNATEATLTLENVVLPAGAVYGGTAPTTLTVTFQATLADPFPSTTAAPTLSVQSTVDTRETGAIPSRPSSGAAVAPTVTAVDAAPLLIATRTDAQASDADGDGRVDPGEDVTFTTTLTNTGDQSASDLTLSETLPGAVTLASGQANTSLGTLSGQAIGATAPQTTHDFTVTVNDPPEQPAGSTPYVNQFSSQGTIATSTFDVADLVTDDPATAAADDPTTVAVPTAELVLTQAADDARPPLNGAVALTLTLTNNGPDAATGVTVRDALPSGLAFQSATGDAASSYDPASGDAVWDVGTVPAGDTRTLTINATLTTTAAVTNSATIETVDPRDPVPGNEDASVTLEAETVDVALTADVPAQATYGTDLTYTLSLDNTGNGTATGVEVTAPLPGGLDVQSIRGTNAASYNPAGGDVVWTPGPVPSGGSAALQVTVRVAAPSADQQVTAEVTALAPLDTDSTPADGQGDDYYSQTLTPQQAALSLSGPSDVAEGTGSTQALTYTVTLSEPLVYDVTAAYATQDGTATAGADFASASGTLTIPAGNTTASVDVTVQGDATFEPDETFALTLANPSNATIQTGTVTTTLTNDDAAPQLTVQDVSVIEGEGAQFIVTLDAPSGTAATVDYRTQGGTATAGSDYTAVSGTLTFPAGTTEQTVPVATADDASDESAETFELALTNPSGAQAPAAPATATIEDNDADLSVALAVSNATPAYNEAITVTLSVTGGQTATSDVRIEGALPSGLSIDQVQGDGAWSYDAATATGTWTLATLGAAETKSLTIEATAQLTSDATLTSAIVSQSLNDPVANNNSDSVVLTAPSADLSLAVSGSDTTPDYGTSQVVTYTLTNDGPSAAADVSVSVQGPSGLSINNVSTAAGTFSGGTWTLASIASGDAVTLSFTGVVNTSSQVTTNGAVSAAAVRDPDSTPGAGTGEDDTASLALGVPAADVSLALTSSASNPLPGEPFTITLTLTNDGPGGAGDVSTAFPVPTGFTLTQAMPSSGSYSAATGVWQLGLLDASNTATLALTGTVDSKAPFTSVAEVTAAGPTDPDSAPGNGVTTEDDYATLQTTPLPVELVSFRATQQSQGIGLSWKTASETNNAGFAVLRRVGGDSTHAFTRIGFVAGAGTTTAPHTYRFVDAEVPFAAAKVAYRLRQVDTDGRASLVDPVIVERAAPTRVALHANFPNPFQQQTTLRYELPVDGPVRVAVYDVLGRAVRVLVNDTQTAGRKEVTFRTRGLASGVYFLRLTTPAAVRTQRMTVVR